MKKKNIGSPLVIIFIIIYLLIPFNCYDYLFIVQ